MMATPEVSTLEVLAKIRPDSLPESDDFSVDEKTVTIERRSYEVSSVIAPDVQEAEWFSEKFAPLVDTFLVGHSVAVLAYGQTGSGKTTAMMGLKDEPNIKGIIWRALYKVFAAPSASEAHFEVSCAEIYQEEAWDLLSEEPSSNGSLINASKTNGSLLNASNASKSSRQKLQVQLRKSGFGLPDLTKIAVFDAEGAFAVAQRGQEKRTSKATEANARSSRSHFLFTLTKLTDAGRPCRIEFVDLAGSENPNHAGAPLDLIKEGICINQSLLSLTKMVDAIRLKNPHIPVRDSELTKLLSKSMLSPGCKVAFIVCMNLLDAHESHRSLAFAEQLRGVKVTAAAVANRPRAMATPAKLGIGSRLVTSTQQRVGSALKRPGVPLNELQAGQVAKKPGLTPFKTVGNPSFKTPSTSLRAFDTFKSPSGVVSITKKPTGSRTNLMRLQANSTMLPMPANSTMLPAQANSTLLSGVPLEVANRPRDSTLRCVFPGGESPIAGVLDDVTKNSCLSPIHGDFIDSSSAVDVSLDETVLPAAGGIFQMRDTNVGAIPSITSVLPPPLPPSPVPSHPQNIEFFTKVMDRLDGLEKSVNEIKGLMQPNANCAQHCAHCGGACTLKDQSISMAAPGSMTTTVQDTMTMALNGVTQQIADVHDQVVARGRPKRMAALKASATMLQDTFASPRVDETISTTPGGRLRNKLNGKQKDEKARKLRFILNNGKEKELKELPVLGPKTARLIISFRDTHGKFRNFEDLAHVAGFPYKKFMKAHGLDG